MKGRDTKGRDKKGYGRSGTIHVAFSIPKQGYERRKLSDEQRALLTTEPEGVVHLDALAKLIGGASSLRESCATGACACLSSSCCGGGVEDLVQTLPAGAVDLDRLVELIGGRDRVASTCGSGQAVACACFSSSCCGGALQSAG